MLFSCWQKRIQNSLNYAPLAQLCAELYAPIIASTVDNIDIPTKCKLLSQAWYKRPVVFVLALEGPRGQTSSHWQTSPCPQQTALSYVLDYFHTVNPVAFRGNYSATLNNMKLVHWPLMGGLIHLVQWRGEWVGHSPPRPLLAVPNVTAHSSTASVPITVMLYDGPLHCGFNVPYRVKEILEIQINTKASYEMFQLYIQ